MPTFEGLPIEDIEERHLQELLDQKIQESRDLDFKRDAIGSNDDAKKEFLKDVVAFANTAGGNLIIGIGESDGVASLLKGITTPSSDQEIRRLGSIIENGIEPRMVGVRIHPIVLASGGYALLIRVPVSWNPPHRVVFARQNRFFARNSAGAYELSVDQLRAVFLGGADLSRRIAEFRAERLARLGSSIGGPRLEGRGQLVIHIVPLAGGGPNIDLSSEHRLMNDFQPLGRLSNINYRYNLDGFLVHGFSQDQTSARSLCQIFRDGRIEFANSDYT